MAFRGDGKQKFHPAYERISRIRTLTPTDTTTRNHGIVRCGDAYLPQKIRGKDREIYAKFQTFNIMETRQRRIQVRTCWSKVS
jgi:hypothetical protein